MSTLPGLTSCVARVTMFPKCSTARVQAWFQNSIQMNMTSPTRPDLLGRSSFSRKVSHSVLSKSPCTDVLSCVHTWSTTFHTWSTTWTQRYVGLEPSSHHLSTEENHNCSLYLQPSWQVQISTTYTTRLIFRRILLTNILSVSVAIATTSPSITHLEVRNLSCK